MHMKYMEYLVYRALYLKSNMKLFLYDFLSIAIFLEARLSMLIKSFQNSTYDFYINVSYFIIVIYIFTFLI